MASVPLGDDPGQRADRRRPLRRHHDRHRRSSGSRCARVDRPRRHGRRRRARHDDRPLPARRRGERRAARVDRRAHAPTRSSPRASRRACPPTIVGNGAELPRFDHAGRARRVRATARRVVDPAARAVPLPRRRRPRARRAADADRDDAWPARALACRDAPDAVGDAAARGRARCSTSPRSGPGPFATAWLCAMGADVIKVEAVQRPDGIRFSAAVRPQRRSAVLREVGAVPRVQPRQARDHARSRPSRRPRAREAARSRGCDVVVENFTPQVLEQFGLDYDDGARACNPTSVMLRMPAFGLDRPVARPPRVRADDGADHRHGVGDRLRGRPADHPRRRRSTRWSARTPRSRSSPRSSTATRTGEGQLVEVPLVEVATAVTAEQVIRYSIDGTLLDRRGDGRRVPVRGRRRVGRGRPRARPDAGRRARATWCATRDAGRRRRGAARARASRRPRWCPAYATLDDPQLRARGFFETDRRTRTSATQRVPDVADAHVGRARRATGRGPAPTLGAAHRRGAARRARRRPTTSSRACAPST